MPFEYIMVLLVRFWNETSSQLRPPMEFDEVGLGIKGTRLGLICTPR